ncbi:hypothetical protein Tco_0370225, partial [Tanacetum coccineum]
EISTSEEYVHSSPYIVYRKGPSNSLLNWYKDLSDEYKDHPTNAKPTFSDISKAKALILAKVQPSGSKAKASRSSSSKAKVQPARSRAKASSLVPITNDVLGLANAKIWDAILSKTFGVKLPPTMTCAEEKKGKRKIEGLLDWYGYDTIKEYLEETFFPSTYKDSTNEDTIHESYSSKSKANVHTWNDILKKFGVRKPKSFANKAKGKRKFVMLLECLQAFALQQAFALLQAITFAASSCNKHLLCCKLVCCKLLYLQLHLQQAFAISICFRSDDEVELGQGVNYAVAGATALDSSFLEAKGVYNSMTNASLRVQLAWFKLIPASFMRKTRGKFVVGDGDLLGSVWEEGEGIIDVKDVYGLRIEDLVGGVWMVDFYYKCVLIIRLSKVKEGDIERKKYCTKRGDSVRFYELC